MNKDNNQEIEVFQDEEIDNVPVEGGLVNAPLIDGDIIDLADTIVKRVEAAKKIRVALLNLAQSGDWVMFGEGDKAKANLGYAGSMRVASTLGVSFTNFTANKETWEDEIGKAYRWEFECDAVYRGQTIRVYGRASSRDKFFGKSHGEFKPLSNVDEGNVKIAARRAAMKEGVKALFGLHSMNPVELKQHGVILENAGGYSFKSKEEQANSAAEIQEGEFDVLKITKKEGTKNGKNWEMFTIWTDESTKFTTFSKSMAEEAKNAKDTSTKVKMSFVKDNFGNTIKTLEAVK